MQLNDTTNDQGIYQDIDWKCGTDTGTFPENDKKRLVNLQYEQVQHLILLAMGSWDENQSTVTLDLVANTRAYNFASSYLQVKKVQINFGDGVYVEAEPIDERNLTTDLTTEAQIQAAFSNNNPKYQLIGDSIKIYSGEISAVSSGIKIWVEVYKDTLTNNTDVPKIPSAFHEILSLGPSISWASKQEDEVLERSLRRHLGRDITGKSQYDGLLGQLQLHYSNRFTAQRPQVKAKSEIYE